jgi:hypothetical protein
MTTLPDLIRAATVYRERRGDAALRALLEREAAVSLTVRVPMAKRAAVIASLQNCKG